MQSSPLSAGREIHVDLALLAKLGALLLTAAAVATLPASSASGHGDLAAEPDSGFTNDLDELRERGDLRSQRNHVWEVIHGLTQSSGALDRPLFESWYGEEAVFSRSSANRATRGIRGFSRVSPEGRTLAAKDGLAPQSAGVPVFTYTLFNEAAYRHIRGRRLNRISELERLRTTGEPDDPFVDDRSIPPFPAQAVVLKTVWWPVAQDAITALPVWDPEQNPPLPAGNSYTSWQRVVAIDPAKHAANAPPVHIDFAGRTFLNVRRFDLDAFYYVVVEADMAKRMMRDREARNASFMALGRLIHSGDYLLLVGVNLATKEIKDWVWATLWWHDRPDQGPFAADRGDTVKSVWRNYLLQVAFDSDKPAELDGGPHICFNPWLEGRFPDGGHGGGTVSNCLACHRRASYPAVNFLPVTRGAPVDAGDPAYVPGRLRTGFLWSIALHARP